MISAITQGFSLFFTVHALWSSVRPTSLHTDESHVRKETNFLDIMKYVQILSDGSKLGIKARNVWEWGDFVASALH